MSIVLTKLLMYILYVVCSLYNKL